MVHAGIKVNCGSHPSGIFHQGLLLLLPLPSPPPPLPPLPPLPPPEPVVAGAIICGGGTGGGELKVVWAMWVVPSCGAHIVEHMTMLAMGLKVRLARCKLCRGSMGVSSGFYVESLPEYKG